jgi:HTH-type transcriptional regulator/antitoxin HigA
MTEPKPFKPDWIVHPNESIKELLAERELSQAEFAARMGISKKHANDLVGGRAGISADTAVGLAAVLGSTAQFWMNLQANFDAETARFERERALAADHEDWLKELPVKDMVDWGWMRAFPTVGARIEEALRYFGVATVAVWRAHYEERVVAFRTSEKLADKPGATAAWLRRGEVEAGAMDCAPWDAAGFKLLLPGLRALTREPDLSAAIPTLQAACAMVGVAVVLVRAPKGCRASGATFFLTPDKAVLMLSARFLSDDHLWFSFFHEAGHLVLHGKKQLFIEGTGVTNADEDAANRFARDQLIPPSAAARLPTLTADGEIVEFAREIGVSPGVVVGRMQHDEVVPRSYYNGLKVRYTWGEGV